MTSPGPLGPGRAATWHATKGSRRAIMVATGDGAVHRPSRPPRPTERYFGITTSNVFGPLLTVVLIPDLAGSAYLAGTSTIFGAPLALPCAWAMNLPVAWPFPATVSTPMLTSPRGTFCSL